MAGLLSDVLPFLYSQGDRLKRHAKGLLADPAGTMAQTAGLLGDKHREQQGLMAQAFGDKKAPFRVTDEGAMMQAAQAMLNGPLGMAPAGITAWHGSPHIFDKFDSSKIGTGEGAQAYGYGLYLAESPGVAKSYAEQLSTASGPAGDVAKYWRGNGGESAYRAFAKDAGLTKAEIEQTANIIRNSGNVYKVDLPDEAVAKMLDWDKPLSQQAKAVQQAAKKLGIKTEGWAGDRYVMGSLEQGYIQPVGGQFKAHVYGPGDQGLFSTVDDARAVVERLVGGPRPVKTGQQLYERAGAEEDAAQKLRALGIPGIRYLDGGSRGAGGGTSNFVVFPGEENILKILERNGAPIR